MARIFEILYVTPKGVHRQVEIGAFDTRGAINSTFELRDDVARVIRAKPTDEWK